MKNQTNSLSFGTRERHCQCRLTDRILSVQLTARPSECACRASPKDYQSKESDTSCGLSSTTMVCFELSSSQLTMFPERMCDYSAPTVYSRLIPKRRSICFPIDFNSVVLQLRVELKFSSILHRIYMSALHGVHPLPHQPSTSPLLPHLFTT